jgi:hypothetical protein
MLSEFMSEAQKNMVKNFKGTQYHNHKQLILCNTSADAVVVHIKFFINFERKIVGCKYDHLYAYDYEGLEKYVKNNLMNHTVFARCHENDVFNPVVGIKIAHSRFMKCLFGTFKAYYADKHKAEERLLLDLDRKLKKSIPLYSQDE